MNAFTLTRNPAGRLVCTLADGTVHANVTPVRMPRARRYCWECCLQQAS